MSASDAAPLPRLGEVFFDVRGDSRSMRLSWYADTDVAVFSIWQGGRCTGTFRLPMDDLSRMIEILQRGPDGRAARRAAERGTGERGTGERGARERGARDLGPAERGHDSDRTMVHNGRPSAVGPGDYGANGRPSAVGPADYGAAQYGTGDFSSREVGPESRGRPDGYGADGYGADDYGASDYGVSDYGPGDHLSGDYRPADPYQSGDYRSADQRPVEYEGSSRPRSARHRTERDEPGDYGPPSYEQPDLDETGWFPDAQAERTGQRFVPGPDQRRVGYDRSRPDPSDPGFMDDSEYRSPADPAARPRHSTGRHGGGQVR